MARRPPPRPAAAPQPTARELLVQTWPGRLFLLTAGFKLVIAVWRIAGTLPESVRLVNNIATLGLAVAVGIFAWRLFVRIKRQLLWRVRRKLILSYIFIGVIPSLLILVFFLFAGSLIFMNVCAYLFKDGYDKVLDDARVASLAAATEIDRNPDAAAQTIERVYRIRGKDYPGLSIAYLTPDGTMWTMGRWDHAPPPDGPPAWLKDDTFAGAIALPASQTPGDA